MFQQVRELTPMAQNILEKRYYRDGESTWEELSKRVINHVWWKPEYSEEKDIAYEMLFTRHFIPNSPTLVNSGKRNGGLIACFVVDFPDTIEGIYKTKLDFALIAKKGGGCGTTLSKIRPENSLVGGSTHGYAGGPVKFFDTICHDMTAMTQAGFREMAMMGVMSVYHPDIRKFITAKTTEGKMTTTNISVSVDDEFMRKVEEDETYWTRFKGIKYEELRARDVFNMIVDGAWKNGEPGIIFYSKVNDSPYKYSYQEIEATNPCGEQGLPKNGACNLGSLDVSKFFVDGAFDWEKLEVAIRLSMHFLDQVIDVNIYPNEDIKQWTEENRPVGLGTMGLADLLLLEKIAYGSKECLNYIDKLYDFIRYISLEESEKMGKQFGIPKACEFLPVPRRNITVNTVAPTGSIALLAGAHGSGCEPIFSEFTTRKDMTGTYQIYHPDFEEPYFRCAVASNGAQEVTWKEHVLVQTQIQKYIDSGVSKTCNFPQHTRRDTIGEAFMMAWKLGAKGLTVYRNGSREIEVLSPKNLKNDKCPVCGGELVKESNCKHCVSCDFSMCEIG
jgi:ribonucleoside-diphosphate reductase alpha chain